MVLWPAVFSFQAWRKWREWESVFLRGSWLRLPDIAALPQSSVLSNNKPYRQGVGVSEVSIIANLPTYQWQRGPALHRATIGYSHGTFPVCLLTKMWTLTLFGKYCFQNCFYFLLREKINNFPVMVFTSKLPVYSVFCYIARRHAEKCLGESAYVFWEFEWLTG